MGVLLGLLLVFVIVLVILLGVSLGIGLLLHWLLPVVGHPVLDTIHGEQVQMVGGPAHRRLEHMVQPPTLRGVGAHLKNVLL